MVKKRIDVAKFYDFLLEECENAKNNTNITDMPNGEYLPFPQDCFTYTNDKIFSSMMVLEFMRARNNEIYVVLNILDHRFDYNVSRFFLKDVNNLDLIAEPIFTSIQVLFKRDSKLKYLVEDLIEKGSSYESLDNENLFDAKEENKLIKINYAYEDFYSDMKKVISKKNKLNNVKQNKDILYQKRNEINQLFAWEEGTFYPERIEIDISNYLTFKTDLDKLKYGDSLTINGHNFIVDTIDIFDKKPMAGNITEYGFEIKEESIFCQLHLFAEPDNFNYILDFYKTNRISKGHHLFYCEALYETQDYIYDMTRGMPEDNRKLTQETENISSILAYDPKDFEGFYGDKISEGNSIAEQTEKAFLNEFKHKISALDESFDVRKWADAFILDKFDIDLSNSFLFVQEEYQQPAKKMKM